MEARWCESASLKWKHLLPLSSTMNYARLVFSHNRSSGVELLVMFKICHTGEISVRIMRRFSSVVFDL